MNLWIRFETMFSRVFTFNPNSEVWILVLVVVLVVVVVVLVLGALGFRDRKETDVLQLMGRVASG